MTVKNKKICRTGEVTRVSDLAPSKKCSALLQVDAAEPASRSRLWLGRSPACTHPSPTQRTRDEGSIRKNCISQRKQLTQTCPSYSARVSVKYLCFIIYTLRLSLTGKGGMIMHVVFVCNATCTFSFPNVML